MFHLLTKRISSPLKNITILILLSSFVSLSSALGNVSDQQMECISGTQPGNALYEICMPDEWNGDLIMYAHGIVPVFEQLSLPKRSPMFKEIFTSRGYAYATTSYSVNGITAADRGVDDVMELVQIFNENFQEPEQTIAVGASLGGFIATKLVEEYEHIFDGALSLSGVHSGFITEINHVFDFRNLFDYYFPGVIPGNTVEISQEVLINWQTEYIPRIIQALQLNPSALNQLLSVSNLPVDSNDPQMIIRTVLDLLSFNIITIDDINNNLYGTAYDNSNKVYSGSDNDNELNENIRRFIANIGVMNELYAFYENCGELESPLVAIHNSGDHVVPAKQVEYYNEKAEQEDASEYLETIIIDRFGHVNITPEEIIDGFQRLLLKMDEDD